MKHVVKLEIGGRTLSIETGRMAKQANGSCVVRYGDTMILATACASTEPLLGRDFFPLMVDYREKAYAGGKIPGGFFKREGRPAEKETLVSRMIDRPIRPLFPEGYKNEVQCLVTAICSDKENDTDTISLIGVATSLYISDIPFNTALAGVRVGRINGALIINPTFAQFEESDLNLFIGGTADSIAMVEGGASEVPEADMVKALEFGHKHIKEIVVIIEELKSLCGLEKSEFKSQAPSSELVAKVKDLSEKDLLDSCKIVVKEDRKAAKRKVKEKVLEALGEEYPDSEGDIKAILHDLDNEANRRLILDDNRRIDGRGFDEVREITIETSVLPRTHGSALFTRGQTQSLSVLTLGTKIDEQRIDDLEGEGSKSFMLHYNFPPSSVGEVRPIRGVGRREIGHGALAERALQPVIPSDSNFPYTVRIVSEILESNGSSSMATVCGGSLAMMDGGAPIKCHVAGIAMGLIKENDKVAILTDILGDEDHFGDMDFKVCGTEAGITAFQMDIKISGITLEIMADAMEKARVARLHILGKMNEALPTHRHKLSQYAPRIITIRIPVSKIGDVIGPGGKHIRALIEDTGAKIDISDDGTVMIASVDGDGGQRALERIRAMTEEAEIGKTYPGIVRRITTFGAFVEILPGTDGLVHISELAHERVARVEDILKVGEDVQVKVINIDTDGKIRLSRKALLGSDTQDSRSDKPRVSS
ncbi:MAG: polyribonucleotide nucleotidyltransferase [candidate division Zixibacteria bacterium]|nr:polyribonucleotide nucleotidyltransferase [candidate division Zixibacteria bacterium]